MFDEDDVLLDEEDERQRWGFWEEGPDAGTRPIEKPSLKTDAEQICEDSLSGKILDQFFRHPPDGIESRHWEEEARFEEIQERLEEEFEGWHLSSEERTAQTIEAAIYEIQEATTEPSYTEADDPDLFVSEIEDDQAVPCDVVEIGDPEDSELEMGDLDLGDTDFGEGDSSESDLGTLDFGDADGSAFGDSGDDE